MPTSEGDEIALKTTPREFDMAQTGSDVTWDAICPASALADGVTDRVFMFDCRQRIKLANRAFLDAFCGGESALACGRSLGEILDCRHVVAGGACGETASCAGCGWFQAVESCRRGAVVRDQECRVLAQTGEAFDFTATVLSVQKGDGEPAWVCGLRDTFEQKRLRVQERTFFHDVLNLAAGLRGLSDLIADTEGVPDKELLGLVRSVSDHLVDEIQRLRKLRMAENGDLELCEKALSPMAILRGVAARVKEEADARHLEVVVTDDAKNVPFVCDAEVLSLVLADLFRNAVEASSPGDRVALSCGVEDGGMVFRVRNPMVLAADVREHLFERSFSTCGSGKGIGAYRAKLFGERYLKGRLTFVSQASEGTVVSFAVPLRGITLPR